MAQVTGISKYLACLMACFLLFCKPAKAQTFTHADSLRGAINPLRDYDVRYYKLLVRVDTSAHKILGINTIRFTSAHRMRHMQVDLYSNYDIKGINQHGFWCKFIREGDHVFVDLVNPVEQGKTDSIDILYGGTPPVAKNAPWDGGFIWTHDAQGKAWVAVACEGMGASSWWPCKDHLSDEPDSMDISVEVPYGLQGVCNGQFLEASNQENGYNRFDWRVHYPINTYDVTLNIGNYTTLHDTFASKAGTLSLDYFALPNDVKKAESYFSGEVKPMLRCFEHYFGPYPFTKDGYALVEDPYWGMEHQSAIAYGNNFKKNEFGFDFIIVHETAHEWWGNSLSAPDEAEMWLHESFATYAEALYVEYYQGKEKAIAYLETQKSKIKNDTPMVGPMDVNFYDRPDNDIYYKGTWMLHTLRNMINNDSLWFRILYAFQQQHKYGIVHTQDFVKQVDSLTGQSYDSFFRQYLYHARIPRFVYTVQGKGRNTVLNYRLLSDVQGLQMPIAVEINGETYRLDAGPEEKKFVLKKIKASSVRVRTDLFYVEPVNAQ